MVAALNLPVGLVGATAGPLVQTLDARWLMAYAAALGDTVAGYLDTLRPDGLLAHPLFPVCYEWPAALALRTGIPDEILARGVHATHDLTLHRLPRPGDCLATTAQVVAISPRRSGALVVTRFLTVDAGGASVSATDSGTLYRDTGCDAVRAPAGGVDPAPPPSALGPTRPPWVVSVAVTAGLAHVYSECARIWNPIHTDRAAARAVGLSDIILHGTATLALAVSELVRREAGADPRRVRRIAARFGAMVRLPSTLVVRTTGALDAAEGHWVGFEALTEAGGPAIRDGRLLVAPA